MQILKQNLNTNTIIKRQFLVKIKEIKMNRITINGKTIICSGTNVVISNGKVIVDGKTIQECNSGDIKVTIRRRCKQN